MSSTSSRPLVFMFLTILLFGGFLPQVSSKKYVLMRNKMMNWYGAFQDCLTRGLQLATINDADEQKELDSIIINSNITHMAWLWIAGTDRGEEGNFVWMSTGQPLTYTKWAVNEPNNDRNVEHCINLWTFWDQSYWNDHDCNAECYYVCEEKYNCVIHEFVVKV